MFSYIISNYLIRESRFEICVCVTIVLYRMKYKKDVWPRCITCIFQGINISGSEIIVLGKGG